MSDEISDLYASIDRLRKRLRTESDPALRKSLKDEILDVTDRLVRVAFGRDETPRQV